MAGFGLLDPEFDVRVRALTDAAQRAGYDPSIVSGFRSPEGQAQAIDSVSRKVLGRPASITEFSRGIPGYAAPVGGSQHQKGQAVDFAPGTSLDWLRQNAPRYGVNFPASLAKSDPVHAEVDSKFYGPVQDPRAIEGGPAQPNGPTARPAMPLPMAVGGPPAPGGQPRMPTPTGSTGWGLLDTLSSGMQSPLFQAGAAMVNAGSQGLNPGAGFLMGGEAASKASQSALSQTKQRRELDAMQQRDLMWSEISSGKAPAWAAALPAGTLDLARVLGPDQGTSLITSMLTKGAEKGLDREKLDETRRYHDILSRQADAQLMEARGMNTERVLLMESTRRQKEQELREAEAKAAYRRSIMGDETPTQGGARPVQGVDPNIRPQSFAPDEGQADPNLIRVQQGQAPQAASPAAPPMVQTPRGPMPPAAARAFGQKMLVDPELRALGTQIIKQADALTERGGLGTEASNDIDKRMVSASENLTNLASVIGQYKPEYQEVPTRLKLSWTALKSKYAAGEITPEDREQLESFSAYRADAIDAFNTYIKAITGAAMTESEAQRIQEAFPAAGQGIFDGDDPIGFKAKLDSAYKKTQLAIARYTYAKNNGKDWQYIGLEQMRNTMKDRATGLRNDISTANPNADPAQIDMAVRRELKREFGI